MWEVQTLGSPREEERIYVKPRRYYLPEARRVLDRDEVRELTHINSKCRAGLSITVRQAKRYEEFLERING